MKVMLLFPPNWTPTMPHLALPTLTAFLRGHGVEVVQRDLNQEVFDQILTRDYLEQALTRLRRAYGVKGKRRPSGTRVPPQELVQWALTQGPELSARIEEALAVIRGQAFFDGPTGLQAFETLVGCLQVASLPFYPASLELSTYTPALPADSSRSLLHAVRDPQHNMFLDLYRRGIIADVQREGPDVVGISIPCLAQMLPGMTLAYLIKQAGLTCHVTVGGPHISMLRDQLPQVPSVFQLIDSAVVFDGELPLLRLAEAVADDGDLSRVPNLIYRDGEGRIQVTERKPALKIADLPVPDFDGLNLDRYLAPQLVLPLLTARGCYFGRCAFCNVGYGEPESFSQLRAERVVDQMMTLQEKYGVRHIFFADEAISPRNLRHMSRLLEGRGTPIHWGGCVRFEKVISRELLQGMERGGCRMLLFGLETASEPIIKRMVKGTELEHMSRILHESTEAGIWNHTFFFFGFPGETIDHAQETVNFLYAHRDCVHSAAFGTFLLERYAPAHLFPAQYGIRRIIEDPGKDLAIYFDYEAQSGIDEDMAELLASRFLDALPKKRFGHFYVHDTYRFLYLSHLQEQGQPFPPWLVPETATAAESGSATP
jgi:anaerobic magnesium-protoporphyrin IX monomethyl ester cyclase